MRASFYLHDLSTFETAAYSIVADAYVLIAGSICTLADLLKLESSTFCVRFDTLPFLECPPRIPVDIWQTAVDNMAAKESQRRHSRFFKIFF